MMQTKRFRLYIDEYGSDHFHPNGLQEFDRRYLCVIGLAIDWHDIPRLNDRMNHLKQTYLRAHIADPDDRHAPIILHRSCIEDKKGIFGVFRDKDRLDSFNAAWLDFIQETDFKIISVTIDKASLLNKSHYQIKDPYHWAAMVIVEKYTQFLKRRHAIGDMMPEERKGGKDDRLQKWVDDVVEKGTRYTASQDIHSRLLTQKLKFRSKHEDIAGLQLADMLAKLCAKYAWQLKHPDHPSVMKNYEHDLIKVVHTKFDCSATGKIGGYGVKYLD